MYLLSNAEMKEVERAAIEDMGVPSIVLMENAAKNAAEIILAQKPQRAVVIAGKGNNGGDGLAIARHLITNNVKTKVYFIGDSQKATTDCKTNLDILKNYNANIIFDNDIDLKHCDIIIDALIGTGLKRKLSEEYIKIVNAINNSNKFVVSIDCPTGINSDTGEDYGIAVNANITVTFHQPKTGLMLYPAYSHTGKIIIKDIGIPYTNKSNTFILDDISIPKRNAYSHKGTYGKALIIAGCDNMTGAAVLNAKACYNAGAGLVNVCSTDHVIDIIQNSVSEAITTKRENIDYNYGNVCAIGSGLGRNYSLVETVILNCNNKLIIDADGLNSLSENTDLLLKHKNDCIITPHIMEMSRLTGLDASYIKQNMIETAKNFAQKYNVTVVLKDTHTIIASPEGKVCINITGTPAMSKGGTGDCLCGVITGLAAQGINSFDAACMGAYINGKAGEYAEKKLGSYSTSASDIVDNLYHCFI